MPVFEYSDYKEFLKDQISSHKHIRGYLSRLAEAAKCQKSYLTQVIKGHVHFTPEHAMGASTFWDFSESETDFFVELVHFARTDHGDLKRRITKRLKLIREEQENLSKRFSTSALQEPEIQQLYYSNWVYCALHILVSIPQFQTISEISKRLNLPNELAKSSLEELKKLGLVEYEKQRWKFRGSNLHLAKGAALLPTHHHNWRARAVLDSQNHLTDGIHYTAVQTLTLTDFEKIKTLLLQALDQQRKIVLASEEDEMACLALDWFKI